MIEFARIPRRIALAATCLLATAAGFHALADEAPLNAALVTGGLPGQNPFVVMLLKGELKRAGYEVLDVDTDGLCDPAALTPGNYDLLVLCDAAFLPEDSIPSIGGYLQRGGDIIAFDAPLWQEGLINVRGAWVTRAAHERETAAFLPQHMLFGFRDDGDIAEWRRSHHPFGIPAIYGIADEGPTAGWRSLHVKLKDLKNWDNFGPEEIEDPFPEGHTLTVFAARGGPDTTSLAVEWQEKDGSRWIGVVPLSAQWRRYVLAPEDFKFWESVPERRDGTFNPANAVRMCVGLAFSHTGTTPGSKEYWVSAFGTAEPSPEYAWARRAPSIPPMDALCPAYKFYETDEVTAFRARQDQAIVTPAELPLPGIIRSPQPRPGGGGFSKGRAWRWIPLLEARDAMGDWCGTSAALIAHCGGPFKGAQWACFGVADSEWYQNAEAIAVVGGVAQAMWRGVYIIDGGADSYTYFEDQPIAFGVRAANVGRHPRANMTAQVIVVDGDTGAEVVKEEWPLELGPGEEKTVGGTWKPERWPKAGFQVTARLLEDGGVFDKVVHEAHVWRPKEEKSFITVEDGEFVLDGERWRAHGVNYMPSSGIGTEDRGYFEQWMGTRAYHPEIIQRDLEHVKSLGMNSVSVFIYHESIGARNLLDFLRRCDRLRLKVNLSIRPGTPMDFRWDEMREIIEHVRLWEHDTVFALDLAWEPMWLKHKDRARWDKEWEAWILERYGSLENAERDWSFEVPRDDDGNVTNPSDDQVRANGAWRRMVAAYRRCLDTLLYKYYSRARTLVKSVDPNHLVSFRMTEAGNPTMDWGGVVPYDFPYLAAAVDILEPEGYGRIGDWDKVKPGWFEFEYARWAAPGLPVMWAEAGVSAWDRGADMSTDDRLEFQGQYLRDFYRMLIASCADGIYWWWYPGGFRVCENSDYGIINPGGSDRPATVAIRDNAWKFTEGPSAGPVDYWIEIDRDEHANGVAGIYSAVKDEFWQAIEDGHVPGLKTSGTGTDSAGCPLLAVGNTPCDGSNPPKYLDGFFDRVEVRGRGGDWVDVCEGGCVEAAAEGPIAARVTITNLGEAAWLHEGDGAVCIVAAGATEARTPLPARVPHLGAVTVENVTLAESGIAESTKITLSLLAVGRTPFGDKYGLTLVAGPR